MLIEQQTTGVDCEFFLQIIPAKISSDIRKKSKNVHSYSKIRRAQRFRPYHIMP